MTPNDPERHIRDAIAGYPRDAIVDAIVAGTVRALSPRSWTDRDP